MSNKRYTEEFKAEALKQILERGYPVREISDRLGVSGHSLYAWLKKAKGQSRSKDASNLDKVLVENARLKAELKRVEENRDILKKAAYFAKASNKVRVYQGSPHRAPVNFLVQIGLAAQLLYIPNQRRKKQPAQAAVNHVDE